jgi:hypothetical protein
MREVRPISCTEVGTSCQQDDLLAALNGTRASELDHKLAATPIIQKLLLADGAFLHLSGQAHNNMFGLW